MHPLRSALVLGTALCAVVLAQPATAQISGLAVELTAGSLYEPRSLSMQVRGSEPAGEYVRGCPGFLPPVESAVAFDLRGSERTLRFYLDAEEGAALLVRSPDGIYHCAPTRDDGIAQQVFEQPLPGSYAVWPAPREADSEIAARVLVSEQYLEGYRLRPRGDVTAETLQPAREGNPSFDGDPALERQLLASAGIRGMEPAASVASYCTGYVDFTAADVTLTLEERQSSLSLFAESATDTVMMVLDPAGVWHCNDDSQGMNPAVTLSPAPAGDYQILVGSYSEGAGGIYELWASRGSPRWSEGSIGSAVLGFEAEPAAGRLRLSGDEAGRGGERLVLSLSGADGEAGEVRSDCRGYIDFQRPDAVLTLEQEEPQLTIYAVSGQDTTLLVHGPDGWIDCNDDFEGLNPGIVLNHAPPGDYAIWVGSYHRGEAGPATLGATRGHPDWTQDRGAALPRAAAPSAHAAAGELGAIEGVVQALLPDLAGAGISAESVGVLEEGGLVLHGVRFAGEAVTAERVRVEEADFAALAEGGLPRRFRVFVEGMPLQSFVDSLMPRVGLVPLDLRHRGLSAMMAVRPDAEETGLLALESRVDLHGVFAVTLQLRAQEAEAFAVEPARFTDHLKIVELTLALENESLLVLLLEEEAARRGVSLGAVHAEVLAEMELERPQRQSSSLEAQLHESLILAVEAYDRPGTLRARVQLRQPATFEELAMGLLLRPGSVGELIAKGRVTYEAS